MADISSVGGNRVGGFFATLNTALVIYVYLHSRGEILTLEIIWSIMDQILIVFLIGYYNFNMEKTYEKLRLACLRADEANNTKTIFMAKMRFSDFFLELNFS
jgi:hypothetical protein